jgi:ABC-type branched-subunit amino acid transport system permease subunit
VLNYIWVALILLGVGAALTTDIINSSTNRYKNDTPIIVTISFNEKIDQLTEGFSG